MTSTNKSVYTIASELQRAAHEEAKSRLNGDINKLKGEAHEVDYTNRGLGKYLGEDICKIDEKYSNARNESKNPCHGKGDRLNVGTDWKNDKRLNKIHQEVYLPPRRQHICTSNLENLDTSRGSPLLGGQHGNAKIANNSFLGDVLLAAKMEGTSIANKHKDKHISGVCRSMKYSFADLGDIIRGRDLWSEESGNKQLQEHLVTIFGKIKGTLPNGGKGKYDDNDTNHTQLRQDWWESNRKEIWKAMTCDSDNSDSYIIRKSDGSMIIYDNKCGRDKDLPYDDYIPQRLRWMTEWAEWFCKKQKMDYESLKSSCGKCKSNDPSSGECMRDSDDCNKCTGMCTTYKNCVQDWKRQWDQQKTKYGELYKSSGTNTASNDPNEKQLDDFFKKLKEDGKPDYDNAAGYIKDIGSFDCKEQKDFSDSMASGYTYAFRPLPHEYDHACTCKERSPSNTSNPEIEGELPTAENQMCSLGTVNSIINENHVGGQSRTDHESTKTPCGVFRHARGRGVIFTTGKDKEGNKKWLCTYNKDKEKKNLCVPPRVQEMCLGYLDNDKLADKITSTTAGNDMDKFKDFNSKILKEILLTASLEGQQLWKLYTQRINNDQVKKDRETKSCAAIKRSFHDLGDLIKGTNIWHGANAAEVQLKTIFEKLYELHTNMIKTPPNNRIQYKDVCEFRKGWWATHKKQIWKAFNCSSNNKCGAVPSYDIPQFLRWLEEWSDDFCKERKKQLESMKSDCEACKRKMANQSDGTICKNNKCPECKKKCEVYKNWKTEWTNQWQNLEQYFNEQKNRKDSELHKYLKDQDSTNKEMNELIKNGFVNNNCTYEKTLKEGTTLTDLPHEYSDECDCTNKMSLRTNKNQNNSGGITSEKSKICDGVNNGTLDEWDCTKDSNMCVKKNDKITIDNIIDAVIATNKDLYDGMNKEDIVFYYWFEKWLEDMERYLDKYINYLKLSCGNDELKKKNKVHFFACSNCKTECGCYDKLHNNLESKWEEQKRRFEKYKKTSTDSGIMELPLNYYLYARCENKLEEKEKEDENIKKKKCGEMENKENIIDKMIDDQNNEKDKLCDKCQKVEEDVSKKYQELNFSCDTVGNVDQSCPRKRKRGEKDYKWNCNNANNKDICIPERKNQLCLAYITSLQGNEKESSSKDTLKSYLYRCAKVEAERLWEKHTTNNVLDEDAFKKDLRRSYNDYRDVVQGTDLHKVGDATKVQNILKKIFETSQNQNGIEARKKWWDEHKYHVWEAMKCGIKNKDKKNTYNFFLEVDDDPQIERWIKEWGDDFYEERKKEIIKFGTDCKTNSNDNNCTKDGSPRTDEPCKDKCDNYKKWLDKKKEQWKVLSEKWKKLNNKLDSSNNGTSNSNMYDEPNDYLLYDCVNNKNGCNFSDFSELLYIKGTNTNGNTDCLVDKDYGQFQNYCTCIYGIDITPNGTSTGGGGSSTFTIKDIDPCVDKINTSHCNDKTFNEHDWTDMYTDAYGRTQYLNGVQIPPRRRQLCLATLMAKPRNKDDLVLNLYRLAKREAQLLREKYKTNGVPNSGNSSRTCRAIKRSYGDIHDIILQNDYVDGFSKYYVDKNINETLKDENDGIGNGGATKHSEDEIKKERKNFWETNKKKLWNAMTCNNNNICGKDAPEDNDEFLRWLEEWYESFCEEKKEQLDKLEEACKDPCEDKCGTTCDKCLKQCPKYEEWLHKKKDQWRSLSKKYNELKMKHSNNTLFQDATKDNSNAQVYLNILCNKECSCGHKDQSSPSNNALKIDDVISKKDDDYKNKYSKKCLGCELKTISNILTKAKNKMIKPNNPQDNQGEKGKKLKPAPSSDTDDICDKVKECIDQNDQKKKRARDNKGDCNEKTDADWNCNESDFKYGNEGACMPPRRQKLCIHYLQHEIKEDNANEENLKNAFIKCAALEIKYLWEKYKKDKQEEEKQNGGQTKTDLDSELKKGIIPEIFKRQMFYTYGDFRDLCLGKDIGKNTTGGMKNVKDNIDKIFQQIGKGGKSDYEKRKEWWETNGPLIWEGMLCGLSHTSGTTDTERENVKKKLDEKNKYSDVKFGDSTTIGVTLPQFVARPQFLRWMIEWGEDFCKHYTKEYNELQTQCQNCNVSGKCNDCTLCQKQCPKYEGFIKKWKPNYTSQSGKYDKVKNDASYKSADNDVETSKGAHDYLKKKLTKMCTKSGTTGDCNCMKEVSKQSSPLPESLDEKPDIVKGKCPCTAKPAAPKPVPVKPAQAKPLEPNPRGSQSQPGRKLPSGTPGCDKVDKGVCHKGGGAYDSGLGKPGGVDITFGTGSSSNSAEPQKTVVDGSVGGGSGGGNTSGKGGPGAAGTSQNGGNGLLNAIKQTTVLARDMFYKIKDPVSTYAPDAAVLGAVGTITAISTAAGIIPTVAAIGLGAGTMLYDKINTAISNPASKPNGQGHAAVNNNIQSGSTVPDPTVNQGTSAAPGQASGTHVPMPNPNPSHPGSRGSVSGQSQQEPPVTLPSQKNDPINSDIFSSTLPVGISVALGSIALLFYMKKKPILPPADIFRVLDIPQNDYGIPDETSTNRYVPYGKYKGKTYIYVEGDESDHYSYLRDISSSDLTSSESEYDELDINDIYTYKSPKYKTLIEVVLKPSKKTYDVQDDTSRYQKDDSYKLTDNEWNQKKQDFIAQYLQHIGPEVPLNDDLPNDNIPKDIHPNILDVNIEEKPFITQIQDRVLHDDHEVTYNINWNIPKQKEVTSNFTDNPKYVSNNIYTGIDLINDSLNRNHNVDIYDELLKRKENELYKTNNVKSTSTLYDFGNMSNNYAH